MQLNDDILLRYLNGELSPEEHSRVEALIASTPDLEERIAGYDKVERSLPALAVPLTLADEQFIKSTGEKLTAALPALIGGGAAATATSGATAATIGTGAATTFSLPAVLTLSTVAIGLTTTLLLVNPFSDDSSTPPADDKNPTEQVQMTPSLSETMEIPDSEEETLLPAEILVEEDLLSNVPTASEYNTIGEEENSLPATSFETTNNLTALEEEITRQKEALERAGTNGDIGGQIIALNRLGKLYSSTGKTSDAERSFSVALRLAEAASDLALTAETAGQYALFLHRQGNTEKAEQLKKQCLQASANLPDMLEKWQKNLELL